MPELSPPPVESLTKALVEANDQLVTLYKLTAVTMQSLDEQETARTILTTAADLLEADLRLWSPKRSDPNGGDALHLHTEALHDRRRNATPDDHQLSVELESTERGSAGRLEARRDHRPFGTADRKLLTAVANLVSGAVNAARLHEAELSQAIVARDHDTASALARRALPDWRPAVNGLEVYAESLPARAAGGDLFCFAVVDDTVHFAVGDVSGKGLPAAMMMTTVISAATASFQGAGRAGAAAAMTAVDAWVYDYLNEAGLFVTLVIGQINTTTATLSLVNAGHSPVLLVSGDDVQVIPADVAPVGVLPVGDSDAMTDQRYPLAVGDRFVICSDGLTEQENPSGVMVGEQHLIEALTDRTADICTLGARLLRNVDDFAAGHPQADDRTLVIFELGEPPCPST